MIWLHVCSLLTVSDSSKKLPADQISVTSSGSSGSEMEDLSAANSACSIRLQVNNQNKVKCAPESRVKGVKQGLKHFLLVLHDHAPQRSLFTSDVKLAGGASVELMFTRCFCLSLQVTSDLWPITWALISALPCFHLQSFHSSCNNVSEAFSSSSASPCSSATPSPDSATPTGSSSDCRADTGSTAQTNPSLASQHKRSVSMTSLPLYNRQVADSCIVRVSVDLGHNNGNMYKSILVSVASDGRSKEPPPPSLFSFIASLFCLL